jgi:hypothetical protein
MIEEFTKQAGCDPSPPGLFLDNNVFQLPFMIHCVRYQQRQQGMGGVQDLFRPYFVGSIGHPYETVLPRIRRCKQGFILLP